MAILREINFHKVFLAVTAIIASRAVRYRLGSF